MSKIYSTIRRIFPTWVPTILVLAAVLWLTLAPHPVGPETPQLFDGADKIVHAAMFLALSFFYLFDLRRSRHDQPLSLLAISVGVALSAILGVATELLQGVMEAGRTPELADMFADFFGALVGGVAWLLYRAFRSMSENQ